jgi:epoxyqueuosine reductase QueG
MDKQKNYLQIKEFSQNLGIGLFGVADISLAKNDFTLDREVLEKLNRAVCLGSGLSQSILLEISDRPTKLYFHHYRTVNSFLDQAALKITLYIQQKGFAALPIPASQILDWQNQTAHLSHKKIGVLAGLGWIGRNNLLVNKKFGSQFRLVSVLTDMPLEADKPAKGDCGACRLCLEACPAQAIREKPQDFARLLCFERLKEFQKQKLADQYICGVCVSCCKGEKENRN